LEMLGSEIWGRYEIITSTWMTRCTISLIIWQSFANVSWRLSHVTITVRMWGSFKMRIPRIVSLSIDSAWPIDQSVPVWIPPHVTFPMWFEDSSSWLPTLWLCIPVWCRVSTSVPHSNLKVL
jgi:hypothetical protein